MGILGDIFGGSRSKSNSMVLSWADAQLDSIDTRPVSSREGLAISFIYAVATFARGSTTRKQTEQQMGIDTSAFENDSAVFEVGCFAFVQVDSWLFANRRNLREQASEGIAESLLRIFPKALGVNTVAPLFNQRIKKYGQMLHDNEGIEQMLEVLISLIQKTAGGQIPKPVDFDNDSVNMGNYLQTHALKSKTVSWYTGMMPSLIDTAKDMTAKWK